MGQGTHVDEEEATIREELNVLLEPIRRVLHEARGVFAVSQETMTTQIEKLIIEAKKTAQDSINGYLISLKDANWATLKAAVRRGGTFDGARHIDLPHDFALHFEEPVAEIWGKKLLRLIRERTKTYAKDCVALVEKVLDWAKERGARVNTGYLKATRGDQGRCRAASRRQELIDAEEVKNRLVSSIHRPSERQRFVERNQHVGPV